MNTKIKLLALSFLIVIISLYGYYVLVKQSTFTELLIFGDSLSDVGNFYITNKKADPKEPYYEGRFSNGPLWVEVFAEEMKFPPVKPSLDGGLNYAYGGARTGDGQRAGKPDIGAQINEHLKKTEGKLKRNQLIVICGGSNDFLKGNPIETIPNMIEGIERLAKAGGRTFLVSNFPPLGCLPVFKHELPLIIEESLVECLESSVDPQIQKYIESKLGTRVASYVKKWIPSAKEYLPSLKEQLPQVAEEFAKHVRESTGSELTFKELGAFALNSATEISKMYNRYLDLALDDLQRRMNIKIYKLDLNMIFQEIAANPQKYDILYVDVPALDAKTHELAVGVNVNEYMFFDGVHPVSKTHRFIGEAAVKLFK